MEGGWEPWMMLGGRSVGVVGEQHNLAVCVQRRMADTEIEAAKVVS